MDNVQRKQIIQTKVWRNKNSSDIHQTAWINIMPTSFSTTLALPLDMWEFCFLNKLDTSWTHSVSEYYRVHAETDVHHLFFWLSHLSSIGLDDWQRVKGVLLARFTQWNSITLLIQLVRIQRLAKSLTLWHHAPPRSFPQLMPTVLWNTAFTDVAMFVLFYYASHWKHTVVQCLAAGMIRCGLIISNYTMWCPHTA